jgi:hypothetical protein
MLNIVEDIIVGVGFSFCEGLGSGIQYGKEFDLN